MTKVTHLTTDEHGGLNRRRIHLREISGEADQPLETVGQDLRAGRLRRGDDLAAVSRVLKIRKDHLEAIEEDRIEALPGRTYAVGFVRSYADYLGLDAVQAVERFKAETAGRGETRHQIALEPEEDRPLPHGWIVIAVVLLAIVVYGAYLLTRSADTLLRQPVAPVPARIAAQPPPLANARPAPMAIRSAPALVSAPALAPPQPSVSPPGAGASDTTPSASSAAGTQPQSQAAPAQLGRAQPGPPTVANPSATPSPEAGAQLAALPPGKEFGAQNKVARVILRAKSLTRVLVQGADGTVFFNRSLHPGDSYRVPNKIGLTLTTPDGGAIALELDGQEMGSAGAGGRVTEALSLDPQAIVDRYNGGGPG